MDNLISFFIAAAIILFFLVTHLRKQKKQEEKARAASNVDNLGPTGRARSILRSTQITVLAAPLAQQFVPKGTSLPCLAVKP